MLRRPTSSPVVSAFRLGLNEAGYVEGKNVAVEYRWADNQYDRLTELAVELANRRVSVIATGSNLVAAIAAKAATKTIPIVFLTGADPVKNGLVDSLNRPGGHVTGVTTLNVEITPKRFQVLSELLPNASTIAVLLNPINNPAMLDTDLRLAETAAHALGVHTLRVLQASTETDLDRVFSTLSDL